MLGNAIAANVVAKSEAAWGNRPPRWWTPPGVVPLTPSPGRLRAQFSYISWRHAGSAPAPHLSAIIVIAIAKSACSACSSAGIWAGKASPRQQRASHTSSLPDTHASAGVQQAAPVHGIAADAIDAPGHQRPAARVQPLGCTWCPAAKTQRTAPSTAPSPPAAGDQHRQPAPEFPLAAFTSHMASHDDDK